jgi:glyoxylase-like metal-dependent hydrolase (beta-lactamase superfamily II)
MEITKEVYLLDTARGSHAYLVYTPEPVLIDTGLPFWGKAMLHELALLGLKDIRRILLTHHDVDHIGNAARIEAISGAAVYASEHDIPYITGEKERHSFKKSIGLLMRVPSPSNLIPFEENAVLDGIHVIPTPGHTPGHVCFLFKDVLFAGDLLENKKRALMPFPAPWDWDYQIMLESIQKISAYPFTWICPAHGKPIKRKDLLKPF